MKLGFIGLGAMGMHMATNLLKAGFSVSGYDVRAEARAELAKRGGKDAPTLADVASGTDALVLMVVNAAQAEAVLLGEEMTRTLPKGASVILSSTCPPAAVAALAVKVQAAGFHFIDAPVSGGTTGAEAASLTIMAAAPAQQIEKVRPILQAMGSKIVVVGDKAGQGATAKTVNQLLCGTHLAVAAEALALAEKLGIDMTQMLDIVSGSSASSWMLRDRGPRMLEANPRVTSAVDIFVKDLGIVLEAGRDAGVALPLAAQAHQMFLATSGRGLARADDSQVIETYRAMQGRKGP